MSNAHKMLGILGGMGPMATVYFYELVTTHTRAQCDQQHIDMVIASRASVPDRTAYLLGEGESPLPVLEEEARRLVAYGAQVIAIPCNTSHYFHSDVAASVPVPVLNMVALTVDKAAELGCEKVGILATSGTVKAEVYQRACQERGIAYEVPGPMAQEALMRVIYDDIKAGKPADMERFNYVARDLFAAGCQRLVLGCTELSLIKKAGLADERFIDSMDVLAEAAIHACGYETAGFTF